MADAKITALTAVTALTDDDLFVVVDDPAGTPATKKITVANVKTAMRTFTAAAFVDGGSGIIEQRSGTTAQIFNIYRTFTDASNYERGTLQWSGTELYIGMETTGGSRRDVILGVGTNNLRLMTVDTNRWLINSSGHFLANADNTYDLGADGATRPRVGYFGTAVRAPEYRDTNGVKVLGTQGAAIADAAGGVVIDAEARTALNALLARLRTHGTIAT